MLYQWLVLLLADFTRSCDNALHNEYPSHVATSNKSNLVLVLLMILFPRYALPVELGGTADDHEGALESFHFTHQRGDLALQIFVLLRDDVLLVIG